MNKMKKDLKFDSQRDFEGYVECTLSLDDYVTKLREKKIISS